MTAPNLYQIVQRLQEGTHTPADVESLLQALRTGQIAIATGERAVALGGSVQDTVIVTGDGNIVLALSREPAAALQRYLTNPWDNSPGLPPDVPRLRTLIGREREKEMLLNLYEQVCCNRKGTTVFLSGKTGSGRHALVQWLQEEVFNRGGAVAATCFWDPRLLEEEENSRLYWETIAMARYGRSIAEHFQASQQIAGVPWTNLAAQLLQHAGADTITPHEGMDDPRILFRFVRQVATRRPLLLTVEYLHWAGSLWIDLLRYLADEIAQDLPVLMVITLDAPRPVEQLGAREHTEVTRLVQTLERQQLARALHLGPLSVEEIAASLQTAPEVTERLFYLSQGDPWIVQVIWDEWQLHGAVVQNAWGQWEINTAQDGEWWVYGDLRDHARSLLEKLLSREPPPPVTLEDAETILNCAAIEGEVFTAQAIATALEMNPDDLMDFLDEYLCASADEEKTDDHILQEVGFIEMTRGFLFRYRFARPYLYQVFAKYPMRPADRQRWSQRIAEALERFYYPLTGQIADTLCRLLENAGMEARAAEYRRIPLRSPDLTALIWHVQFLRSVVTDEDVFGNYRLFDVGFQLSGRIADKRPDLWADGYELACDLLRRAEILDDRWKKADALYYAAWHLLNGGQVTHALPWAQRAADLYRDLALDSPDEARGLNLLGLVLQDLGDLAGAKAAFERALRIWEQHLGEDHPNVATAVNNLGLVLRDLGDLAGAKACYERALRIDETVYGPEHPNVASRVNNLGGVLQDLGDLAGAKACFERALRIWERTLPPEHPHIRIVRKNLQSL